MLNLFRNFFFFLFMVLALGFSGALSCGGGQGEILRFPAIVVIDFLNNRLFVIDNQDNGLNLIDPSTDQVITDEDGNSLLNDEDPQLLPLFPSNAAVASLDGVSRIFVIGSNAGPSQQITVLDFDPVQGLQTSPISPINVPGSAEDILVGIKVDPIRGRVFVTNSSTGMVHAFNVLSGTEDPNSPINVGGSPTRLGIDESTGLLAVGNNASTLVNFINLLDLTQAPATLDVGIFTRDVAMASNGSGSILFLSGSMTNVAKVYRLNLADLSNSGLISEILPPAPQDPIPDPLFVTGTLNQVTAGNLTDGRMGAYFTQSSGDLLVVDLSSDLNTLTPAVVTVGAISAEGVAGLLNGSAQITKVYYASPGIGGLTIVDPLLNEFIDQIN